MNKKEIIESLISHSYEYDETEKGIEVKIKNRCRLILIFKDDLLIECKDKIKRAGLFQSWTNLSSVLRSLIIGFPCMMLFAIAYNLFFENVPFFKINVFYVMGICLFIFDLCFYYHSFKKIKKAKEILGIGA